jgi:hypothetical protein
MALFVFLFQRTVNIFVYKKLEMKIFFKIFIKELLTVILALIMVMAAGIITDKHYSIKPPGIKKFEIKLGD